MVVARVVAVVGKAVVTVAAAKATVVEAMG